MVHEIEVKFRVAVSDWDGSSRLTPEFVQKQIANVGETILGAFDVTIHDVSLKDVNSGEEFWNPNITRVYP